MAARTQAVLFDLDGTLFDRDTSFQELVKAQYRAFAPALRAIPRDVFVQRVVELDEHGYVEKALVYRAVVSEFALPVPLAESLLAHFQDTYASFSRCFPEVPAALANLGGRGVKLGIITNGSTRMQEDKIRALGISEFFDTVLISEREGFRKPDRRIFDLALDRLSVGAEEAWYVGDHPVADIRGACDAGLTAVWRRTCYWQTPDAPCHHIDGLDELPDLLP